MIRSGRTRNLHSVKEIRPFGPEDQHDVTGVWYRAGLDEYTYLPTFQALPFEQAGEILVAVIERCEVWVGTEDQRIVAFLAMDGSSIERLYVDPDVQGRGWGGQLLDLAMANTDGGLDLYTHVANTRARAFYESRGFRAVEFGISPPPESMPDVKYVWSPTAQD
ncbi:MAG: GNAT family N-acetyltransferase [Longimicrobiales bacterium]